MFIRIRIGNDEPRIKTGTKKEILYTLSMITNLKSSNIELTAEIRDYLDHRLEGLQKFLPKESDSSIANIELGRITKHQTGDIFRVEINILVGNRVFHAVSERPDLYAAIDNLKDEISRELGSYKEKRLSLLKRGGQKIKNLIRGFSSTKNPRGYKKIL